jgi:excisionase family DNA binding protein
VELFDIKEAAKRLNTSQDQVKGLVEEGRLSYVNIGRGTKRPRYRFTDADIAAFIEANRNREPSLCRFSKSGEVRTTNTISKSVVVGFMAQRNARRAEKQKNSKP